MSDDFDPPIPFKPDGKIPARFGETVTDRPLPDIEWRPQWDALPTMTTNWLVARIDFPHTICPSWLFRGTDAEMQARSLADFLNQWGAGDE